MVRSLNRRQMVGALGVSLAGLGLRPSFAQGAGDIPIGMVLPFTGATGPYGPDMKKAADLMVKAINDAGGILGGRKLQLFIEDSETSATTSVTATHKLLDVNKVELVGGFWGSPEALAAKYAKRVHLDLNDPYLLIDSQPQQSKRVGHDMLRDGAGSIKKTLQRKYNFSNDDAYDLLKENHSNKVRSMLER